MRIWQKPISVDVLTHGSAGSADSHLGIEFLEVGDDYIVARVPVDERTRQPYGLLHGGISVVLAETLGSCGAAFSCPPGYRAVGSISMPTTSKACAVAGSPVQRGLFTGVAPPMYGALNCGMTRGH